MEKRTKRSILKGTLGFLVLMLFGMGTLFVAAVTSNTNPVDFISSLSVPDDGNAIYAVGFTKRGVETDVKIDAGSSNVLLIEDNNLETRQDDTRNDDEQSDDKDKEEPITGSALEQASAIALQYIGEGKVTDTEIGDEEGVYEIEITLNNGREIDVHLDENFKVLNYKSDSGNEDD